MRALSTQTSPPPRLGWVDVAKILGMLLIYIGHMGRGTGQLFPLLYAFHVPLFFLLSGFFALRAARRPFWQTLHRRTVTILVPWVVFSVIAILAHVLDRKGVQPPGLLRGYLESTVQGRRGHLLAPGLWFFPALWMTSLIFDVLARTFGRLAPSRWVPWAVIVAAVPLHVIGLLWNGASRQGPWLSAGWALIYVLYYAIGALVFPMLSRLAQPGLPPRTEAAILGVGVLAALAATWAYFEGPRFLMERLGWIRGGPPGAVITWDVLLALTLCAGVLVVARALAGSELLARMGKDVLIFCGMEAVTRLVVHALLRPLGLAPAAVTPLQCVVWAIVLLALTWYVVVPLMRPVLAWAERVTTPAALRRG